MRYRGVLIDNISLFSTPKIYFQLVFLLLQDCLAWLKQLIVSQGTAIIISAIVWMIIAHVSLFQALYGFIGFAIYWMVLGIASSIGLGTGLHTFVLYLGPHIAKVALNSTICGRVPEMLPSRWNFDHFGQCDNKSQQTIGIFGIMLAVQLQSFLWGFGTAIGELPPYFVAKKAAQTRAELRAMMAEAEHEQHEQQNLVPRNQQNLHAQMPLDEIQQMLDLRERQNLTLVEKVKLFIYNNMQKYGFWAILACASIPNPLFDLAGITSGHFRIPFKTFFSAVLIGKAVIKMHIQMFFIIIIFRRQTFDILIRMVEGISSSLAEYFKKMLQSKKKQLNQPKNFKQSKSLISFLWDFFIIGMVLFFLKSIMDAYVKEKAITLRDH